MQIAFVDSRWALETAGQERPTLEELQATIGQAPRHVPSPGLLAQAGFMRGQGHRVSFHCLPGEPEVEELARELAGFDQVVLNAPPHLVGVAGQLRKLLGDGPTLVELDPWARKSQEGPAHGQLPEYRLAAGQSAHAEADVAPLPDPVHPWSCPAASPVETELAEARLEAAVRALAGRREADLYLNDDRLGLDMPRLRFLVGLVRGALREHDALLKLHLRAWPGDLLREGLLEHLAMLPVGSLDVLFGSYDPRSLERMGCGLSVEDLERCASKILDCGLAHATRVSVVLGLPGEEAGDCTSSMQELFGLLARARITRLRLSFWLDMGLPPAGSEEQERRFLEVHPTWNREEYQGISDFVYLSRMMLERLRIVGPDFVPGWDSDGGRV